MNGKRVISLRFNSEGIEAALYEKIQQGRFQAKLSLPDYVKVILYEYFYGLEKQNSEQEILYDIQKMYKQFESSLENQNTMLMGVIGKAGGRILPVNGYSGEYQKGADLPNEGGDIPASALEFLDMV